jgi:hypothetical protein
MRILQPISAVIENAQLADGDIRIVKSEYQPTSSGETWRLIRQEGAQYKSRSIGMG